MKMPLILSLTQGTHKGILLLGALGVAAAVALLTWTVGLTTTALARHEAEARSMTGHYSCRLSLTPPPTMRRGDGLLAGPPRRRGANGFDETLIDAIRRLPSVLRADAVASLPVQLDYLPDGKKMIGPRPRGVLCGDLAENPYPVQQLRGRWPKQGGEVGEIALSTALFFFRSPPALGDVISLVGRKGLYPARVVGLIEQPAAAPGWPAIYTTSDFVAKFHEAAPRLPDQLLCLLRTGASVDDLRRELASASLLPDGESIHIEDAETIREHLRGSELDQLVRRAPLLVGLAFLVALCIVHTTLAANLSNKIRLLAVLRAIGMTRAQLFRGIIADGLLLGLAGSLAGWALGRMALVHAVTHTPRLAGACVVLPLPFSLSLLMTGTALALSASLIPACRAARMRPMDVLHGGFSDPFRVLSSRRIILAAALILPAWLLALPLPCSAALRAWILVGVAIPAQLLGLYFSAPLWMMLVERYLAPILARLFRLEPLLLHSQLSRAPGRIMGAMITLCIGLGFFLAIQTWGASLTSSFLPDPVFPDAILSFLPRGITEADARELMTGVEEITPGRAMPLQAFQLRLGEASRQQIGDNPRYPLKQDNVLIMGIDPALAFGGDAPLLRFLFTAGKPVEAAEKLAAGPSCVIPTTLARQGNLRLGDTITVETGNGHESQELCVAGIVEINWHLLTARAGVRGLDGFPFWTLGPVFVAHRQAASLKPSDGSVRFIWTDLRSTTATPEPAWDTVGLARKIAGRLAQPGLEVQVSHRDEVLVSTAQHADDLIGSMARLPFWSLAILSLGMVNSLLAGAVSRKNELGVLRAIGMTRAMFMRALLAETLLTWAAGALLSIAVGLAIGWAFTGWTRAQMAFGGLSLRFTIPWTQAGLAIAFALLCSLLLAAIPIAFLVRRKPTALLNGANG